MFVYFAFLTNSFDYLKLSKQYIIIMELNEKNVIDKHIIEYLSSDAISF